MSKKIYQKLWFWVVIIPIALLILTVILEQVSPAIHPDLEYASYELFPRTSVAQMHLQCMKALQTSHLENIQQINDTLITASNSLSTYTKSVRKGNTYDLIIRIKHQRQGCEVLISSTNESMPHTWLKAIELDDFHNNTGD